MQLSPEGPPSPGHPPSAPQATPSGLLADLVMALRFFSRLPTGPSPHLPPDIARIARALPFASLVIGIAPALVLILAAAIGLPPLVAAGLAVGAMALASGAMAEDALADSFDGLFGGADPERRLAIMRDSRHGTYGVLALTLFVLLRVTALAALLDAGALPAAALWLAAGVLSRSGALFVLVRLPPARADGSGAAAGPLPVPSFALGALFALLIAAILVLPAAGPLALLLALGLSALLALFWTVICRRLVGGQTGDLAGALGALIEIGALSAFLVAL